jgi:hypothetical protein
MMQYFYYLVKALVNHWFSVRTAQVTTAYLRNYNWMEITVRCRTLAVWVVSHKLQSHSQHTDSGTQTRQNTDVFMSINTLCASSRYLHYHCATLSKTINRALHY